MVSLLKDCMARREVSGRMANSRKSGLEWFGTGYAQFHEGLHGEMGGFWKDGHFQEV